MPILATTPQAQVRAAVEPLVRSGESPAPVGVIDLDAFDYNAAQMPARSGGLPIRVASKSIRSVAALRRALEHEGYRGILAYSVPEALHLAVSYTHLTLPTTLHECRSRWSPYH